MFHQCCNLYTQWFKFNFSYSFVVNDCVGFYLYGTRQKAQFSFQLLPEWNIVQRACGQIYRGQKQKL